MATLNVVDYGAEGDGRSDDTGAIQSAIDDADSGDTVLFPEGEYYLGSPYLELRGMPDDVTLTGEGELDSELVMAPASRSAFLFDIYPGSGVTGLEIRNLVLNPDRDNQPLDGRHTTPIHTIRHNDATSSSAEIDTLIKNVHFVNGVHTALRLESGGVTVENCEISNHYIQPIGITTDGRTQPLPAIEIRECWIHDFGDSEPNSWVGIDSSDGYSIVEDTVIGPGSGRGFKCSVGHNEHEYRRVRVTGCQGGGVVSTNPSSGYMELEDIVIDDCGATSWGTCRLTGIDYNLVDGSQLVITGNNHTNPGLYVTDGGRLDASNAEVYVNRDAGSGLSANSTANVGYYGHYNNSGGAFGSTSGLSLGESEQADVTDIDAVPTADEVGIDFSDSDDEPDKQETRVSASIGLTTATGTLQTANGTIQTQALQTTTEYQEERYLVISAVDETAEYEITIEGTAEPGDESNTHDHEYQDSVTTDGDYSIIHGHVLDIAVDDYYIEGRIVDARTDHPVTVTIDGEARDFDNLVEE